MTRRHPLRRRLLVALATAAAGTVAVTALVVPHQPAGPAEAIATAANPVTPGVFKGLGFDQCQAPSQKAMDAWLKASPFRAVGIYISGDSRACRYQTYLNATWVSTQLAKGWHLLPIALGPQAACQPRFPRYADDFKISAKGANNYATARSQGTAEGTKSVADARRLGLTPGSTIFYDLEGFDNTRTACRESALRFVSAWNARVKALGYRAGLYSSAGSGMKMIEAARANRTPGITLPDQIWLARYDGKANTSASAYFSDAGWQGARIKQFQGGHNETWGKVTINIDRNYLDLRTAPSAPAPTKPKPAVATAPATLPKEVHCGGRVNVNQPVYVALKAPTRGYRPGGRQVLALKCLLTERAGFRGTLSRTYGKGLVNAVKAWRKSHGMRVTGVWTRRAWLQLFTQGRHPALARGAVSPQVRELQRALNAALSNARLPITGTFDERTRTQVLAYQASVGLSRTGVADAATWAALRAGRFRR